MTRGRAAIGVVSAAVLGACSLTTALDGFSNGKDPPQPAANGTGEDRVVEPQVDAGFEVDAPSIDTGQDAPAIDANRQVACQASPFCTSPQACCIVYADKPDFCVATPEDCRFGDALTTVAVCDDDDDCAILQGTGTVCCGTLESHDLFERIACVPAGSCTGIRLCDQTTKKCPAGLTCKAGPHSGSVWECQ